MHIPTKNYIPGSSSKQREDNSLNSGLFHMVNNEIYLNWYASLTYAWFFETGIEIRRLWLK